MNPASCLNCGTTIVYGQHYCGQCGQKADTDRISLHEITHDAVHYFTHADKGIFHLLRALATRPGVVAREYIDGRRKTYFKPLNWFLIVAGIVVFMTSSLHKEYPRPSNRPAQAAAAPMSSGDIKKSREIGVRAAKTTKITGKYSNVITMLATPLLTFIFWLFYRRGRFSYLEHLVANMYFVPFIMLVYAFVVIPVQYFSASHQVYMYMLYGFFVLEFAYRGIAYYQFMGKKGSRYLFKAMGVSLLGSAFWVSLSYGLIWYYIWYGI